MFDRLSDKLNQVFKKLKGRGHLTEAQVTEALREVRLALLEADVNYKVTKSFIEQIRERAVGEEVLRSLTPAQQEEQNPEFWPMWEERRGLGG